MRPTLRAAAAAVLAAVIVAGGTLALSSPAQAAYPSLCTATGATGRGSATIKTSDGATHTFWYHVSPHAAPSTGRPVLIWMHGDGGTGHTFGSEFQPVMDPYGAILITPNGTNKTWEHAVADIPGHPQDSQFISRIMDRLDLCFNVNHSKYFVGGASRGAFMPYYLLQRSSTRNRIAAAAVNAGLMYCQRQDPNDEMSPIIDPGCSNGYDDANGPDPHFTSGAAIVHLHGTNDTSVAPPPTAMYHDPIDWNVDWRVFWPMGNWAHEHGCFGDGPPADNGVLKQTYNANGHVAHVYDLTGNGSGCSRYQLILVNDGGHVIANQQARIWSFLRQYSAPVVKCHGYRATIIGTSASNSLTGTSGRDVIVGMGGNDIIKAGSGNDVICGGLGNDTIDGGYGADRIYGDDGSDVVSYSSRSEAVTVRLDGNADSGSSNDSRQDLIANDVEQAVGGAGGDFIVGSSASNRLFGQAGNDRLYGMSGSDYCNGGTGTDAGFSCESQDSIP